MNQVLLLGGSGFLGSEIARHLNTSSMAITRVSRAHFGHDPMNIKSYLNGLQNEFDLILNAAGYYSNQNNYEEIRKTIDSNVELSLAVAQFGSENQIPLISLGSYFEKFAEAGNPISYYAASKTFARKITASLYKESKTKFIYLYLYDTYGEDLNRGKFLDELLKAKLEHRQLDASSGTQVINLTHRLDVARALMFLWSKRDAFLPGLNEFQLKSKDEFTLREIERMVDKFSPNVVPVNWGALEDRHNSFTSLWDSAKNIDGYHPSISFEKYLREMLVRSNEN